MHKQELVGLRALCVVLRSRLEGRHAASPEFFRSYDEYDGSPTAIHRNRDTHREALARLLDGLATAAADPATGPDQTSSGSRDETLR